MPSKRQPLPPPFGRPPAPDARKVALIQCMEGIGGSLAYEYDFGDGWIHEVKLETAIVLPEAFETWIHSGENNFPPEDCGGPPGYARLQAYWRDGKDPHGDEEYEDWASCFDNAPFSIDALKGRFATPSGPNEAAIKQQYSPVVKAIGKRAAVLSRSQVEELQLRISLALEEFDAKHGMHSSIGTMHYSSENGHMTIETAVVREDGVVLNREASAYQERAEEFGLSPSWLGKPFQCGKDYLRIVGLKPRSRNAVVVESIAEPGKPRQLAKMHPEVVAAHFKEL